MFNEMTNNQREQLFKRVDDLTIQARDLFLELGSLREELCDHDLSSDYRGRSLCFKCGGSIKTPQEITTITVEKTVIK